MEFAAARGRRGDEPLPQGQDLEPRPSGAPVDIGADQLIDVDGDHLPDFAEIAATGNTSTINGALDPDGDGLSSADEFTYFTKWNDRDTDGDGLVDGDEIALGTRPLVRDSEDVVSDFNRDGVIDNLGAQLGYVSNVADDDGDSILNADEILQCTNPLRADTDGDGIPDNVDAFPHDPRMSVMPSNPLDVAPPIITLTSPWYAVPQ